MDEDRMKHTLAVARKMVEIGKKYNLSSKEQQELFILGFLHDIGYEFLDEKKEHNVIGGEMLKSSEYKYWQEVYYHGMPDPKFDSLFLKILNMADMQIDKYGNDVGYTKRLEDIKSRYGEDSVPYQNSLRLTKRLTDENNIS